MQSKTRRAWNGKHVLWSTNRGRKNTLSDHDPLCEFNSIDKTWVADRHSLISFISSGHSLCGRADGH